jgi:hypothetical protein
MIPARQSTARTIMVGPVLDSAGAAVTTAVVGDFKISKNGGAPAALNASATLTHRHTGNYSLALTASDLDTVGGAQVTLDKTTDTCPIKEITVIEEAVYDRDFAASATGYIANQPVDLNTIKTQTVTCAGGVTVPAATLASTTNITAGTITTTTNLTNLPAITANWLTAAGIAAGALNGKGDWNIGKTGYALSAAGVQAIWDALTTALSTVGSIGKLLVDNINATISSRATESKANDIQVATAAIEVDTQDIQSRLPAALTGAGNMKVDVLAWLGTAPATPTVAGVPKVDVTHFGGMAGAFTFGIPSTNVQLWAGTTAQLTPELLPLVGVGGIGAQGVLDLRAALGLASANLDTQLGDIPTNAEFEARTLVAANYATAANQITVAQIWTTAITESYRATGETGTGAQLFYEILANLINFGNVGTTKTITDLAGSPVKTYTYDSAASPTAIEEST